MELTDQGGAYYSFFFLQFDAFSVRCKNTQVWLVHAC